MKKQTFTIYLGRRIAFRLTATLDEATKVWNDFCDQHPGITTTLYMGTKRSLENMCCSGK